MLIQSASLLFNTKEAVYPPILGPKTTEMTDRMLAANSWVN